VQVKVLDIDRDRQRISLGLKQTQEDPWQRVVDTYNVGDELEGTVTKVVTFGAFVEILDGVEGLVHISELANHHVENPREVVQPGDDVRVKILEIDSDRRRLSLSVKRVEGQVLPRRDVGATAGDLDDVPELGLSEDVFAAGGESAETSASGAVVEPADAVADEAVAADDAVEPVPAEAAVEPVANDDAVEPVAADDDGAAPVVAEDPVAPGEEAAATEEPPTAVVPDESAE
jgi:small subunit ribosomal protein S1